tara:strand:+ start:729 stop:938 length:210 start_codon:yes stop_codon:yes gene_type:complete
MVDTGVPADIQKLFDKRDAKKDKLTDAEKNKIKNYNKALANPTKAAENKAKKDAKRERRAASGSTKSFS